MKILLSLIISLCKFAIFGLLLSSTKADYQLKGSNLIKNSKNELDDKERYIYKELDNRISTFKNSKIEEVFITEKDNDQVEIAKRNLIGDNECASYNKCTLCSIEKGCYWKENSCKFGSLDEWYMKIETCLAFNDSLMNPSSCPEIKSTISSHYNQKIELPKKINKMPIGTFCSYTVTSKTAEKIEIKIKKYEVLFSYYFRTMIRLS